MLGQTGCNEQAERNCFLCVSLKCFQQLAYLQSSLDKLSEAIKLSKVDAVRSL